MPGPTISPPTPEELRRRLLAVLAATDHSRLLLVLGKHYGAGTDHRGHQLRSGHLIIDHPDQFTEELVAASRAMLERYGVTHPGSATNAETPAA